MSLTMTDQLVSFLSFPFSWQRQILDRQNESMFEYVCSITPASHSLLYEGMH